MIIAFACPKCAKEIRCAEKSAGKTGDCPHCGGEFTCPDLPAPAAPPQILPRVVLADIEMSYGSMVLFQLKWFLASIPLAVVLGIIYAIYALLKAANSG